MALAPVLSDHADWPGLCSAIEATEAERVFATHGQTGPMVRYLQERGLNAASLKTEYIGERDDVEIDAKDDDDLAEDDAVSVTQTEGGEA